MVVEAPVGATVKNPPGSVGIAVEGTVVPPASGMNASFLRYSPAIRSVLLPKKNPVGVATIARTPLPRGLRPGFHRNGSPFSGSCAEKPVRTIPPGNGPVHTPQRVGL